MHSRIITTFAAARGNVSFPHITDVSGPLSREDGWWMSKRLGRGTEPFGGDQTVFDQ